MSTVSKRMKEATSAINKSTSYPLMEAVQLALSASKVKFDASVEAHFRLGIDPKKGDQQVRATITLPHGSGKSKRVAVFVSSDKVEEARAAGADIVMDDQDIEKISQSKVIDFDVAIATPDMMPKLAKIAQILGPKGLMPNPKTDTVGTNVGKMVEDQKGGKIAYKNDNTSNVHVIIGKVSFGPEKIQENLLAIVDSIKKAKPASSKGIYMKSATITTSMGPGVKFSVEA
ncbi:TPA: 50S ribosomal protein L1 [Candidatus Uhrbacteria bacterium]|nr:50S ribosomal protein L1 [Candidatus Uhrbacteria bacterium]